MEIMILRTKRGGEWIVGDNCDFIAEHQAAREGDKWYYDIYSPDGKEDHILRIFDPLEAVAWLPVGGDDVGGDVASKRVMIGGRI